MSVEVILDGQRQMLSEQDVKEMLVERALEVAQNENLRWHLSDVIRAITAITNAVYEGRVAVLGYFDHPRPFPEAWALRDELVELLSRYCMKQDDMPKEDWESGWETSVVPQIEDLR